MRKVIKGIGFLLAMIPFAFFASLAFPSPFSEEGIHFLAFIFLIPVFYIIRKSGFILSIFEGLVYGFCFYIFYNYWLKTFHPLAILIAPILESWQYMLLFPILRLCSSLFKKRGYLAQTMVYTAYLYLTQQGFLGYPYGNLTSAIYTYTAFIQIVEITGIWGLGILMVLPQALCAEILANRDFRSYKTDLSVIAVLFLLNIGYGSIRLKTFDNQETDREVRIATVQHSADSWKNGYATYKENFETLKSLTLESLKENPDLVVWSETAFVPSVTWHTTYPSALKTSALTEEFVDFAENLPIPFVTGNPDAVLADESKPPYPPGEDWNCINYNGVLYYGDGGVKDTYRKQHLVPFTEHFPYKEELPWLYELLLANDYNWWAYGDKKTLFDYDGIKFSTPICFEDTFGYLSAEFVALGADLLINVTNDVWSGSVPAEVQHMQLAVFRAIENRRPLLRSTNSGITCLVLPSGRVIDPMEPFIKDYHVYDVPVDTDAPLTFYTRHIDLLPKLELLALPFVLLAGIINVFVRRKKEKEEALFRKYGNLFDTLSDAYEV